MLSVRWLVDVSQKEVEEGVECGTLVRTRQQSRTTTAGRSYVGTTVCIEWRASRGDRTETETGREETREHSYGEALGWKRLQKRLQEGGSGENLEWDLKDLERRRQKSVEGDTTM